MSIVFTGLYVPSLNAHITFNYIDKLSDHIKGQIIEQWKPILKREYKIAVTGMGYYVKDDEMLNVAYTVDIPEELKPLFKGQIPHITLLCDKKSKPANSNKMNKFSIWEKPTYYKAIASFFDKKGYVIDE